MPRVAERVDALAATLQLTPSAAAVDRWTAHVGGVGDVAVAHRGVFIDAQPRAIDRARRETTQNERGR